MNEIQINYLMDLGLSKLQAKVYITLITESNLTGYKIAKILNEPVANSYKALDVLITKGLAILDDSGSNKLYSVISISAYLNQLESTFSNKRKLIEEEFKKIRPVKLQDGVFKIENIEQLYEISKELIINSKDILSVESTHLPLKIFEPYLKKIAEDGVKVFIKAHSKISIPNCDIVYLGDMSITAKEKPIQFFNISNPGNEYASAFLNSDNTHIIEAINCKSKFMSFVAYSGLSAEFCLTRLLADINQGKSSNEILKTWRDMDYMRPSKVGDVLDYFK